MSGPEAGRGGGAGRRTRTSGLRKAPSPHPSRQWFSPAREKAYARDPNGLPRVLMRSPGESGREVLSGQE